MIRVKLRHLMILVLYAAVSLALITPALRTEWPLRIPLLCISLLVLPFVLVGLSALILQPGPHRDWISIGLVCSMMGFVACGFTAIALLIGYAGHVAPNPMRIAPMAWATLLIFTAMGWILFVSMVMSGLMFRRCSCCGKKGLVPSILFTDERLAEQQYVHCDACGGEFFLSRSLTRAGCPTCGQRELRVPIHSFAWCLKCGARLRRRRTGAWVPAMNPQDEAFFWLWTPGKAVRSQKGWFAHEAPQEG